MYSQVLYLKWDEEAQLSSRFRELLSDVFHLGRGDVVVVVVVVVVPWR